MGCVQSPDETDGVSNLAFLEKDVNAKSKYTLILVFCSVGVFCFSLCQLSTPSLPSPPKKGSRSGRIVMETSF
jgi:hypothetical protein